MRILVAPNALKGSLSSADAARAMRRGILRAMPEASVDCLPVADGGDGTLVALSEAVPGSEFVEITVRDPLLRPVPSGFLKIGKDIAVEMARASGLAMLKPEELDPLRASSAGLGDILKAAASFKPRAIYVGIGGSASIDCGAGMLEALGSPFCMEDGRAVHPGGGRLHRGVSINLTRAREALAGIEIIALCDVDNPLTGPQGAAAVFGPQKGADQEAVHILEENLKHAGLILSRASKQDVTTKAGSGAAGGCGAALMALGARMQSGFSVVAERTGLEERMAAADLVLTAEGRLDVQTSMGKAPGQVLLKAQAAGKLRAAFGGSVDADGPYFSIVPGPMTLEEARGRAAELLENAVMRFMLFVSMNPQGQKKPPGQAAKPLEKDL